jgi:serine/threonine-protein phosphatase 6 regulatory subunit 3
LYCRYPYNNFLHHHVENIVVSCLEAKRNLLIDHVLNDCDLVGKVLAAEKNSSLSADFSGVIYS